MNELLQEIKLLPGVIGSTVHINGEKRIFSDLPKVFQSKTADIGRSLERLFKLRQGRDINFIEVRFDESVMLMRPVDREASLITICESGVNFPLVNMTSSMLTGELRKAVEKIRKGEDEKPAPKPQGTKAAPAATDVNAVMNGPLAPVMERLANALALAIGPISDMVMKDTVKDWVKQGPADEARVPELVDMLCREIDDSELEKEFRQQVG
jgi:hypothetical protein